MNWLIYLLAIGAALACFGYGFSLARLLGVAVNPGDAGILGLTSLAILGCSIHFFYALTTTVQLLVIGFGLVMCAAFRRELVQHLPAQRVALAVGASAFFHPYAFTFYDTGLYHLQSVMWNREFPITPGLGNLHGRLAFNSLLYVMAPLDDRSDVGWVSSLLLLVFVLMSLYTRFSQKPRETVEFWFLAFAVGILALFTPASWGGVLNADGFTSVLIVYSVSLWLSLPADRPRNIALMCAAGALALTVKLSGAPLLLIAIAAAWFHRRRGVSVWKPVTLSALLLVLWMVRSLFLSGCAVYPVSQTCNFNLPWAVARAQVTGESLSIEAWARAPESHDYHAVMANWSWLGPWIGRTLQNGSVVLFLAGLLGACVTLWRGARVNRLIATAGAGLALGLAYWFVTAPDVRFGAGYFAAAGILGLSVMCSRYIPDMRTVPRLTLEAVGLAVLIGVAGLLQDGNRWSSQNRPVVHMRTAPGGQAVWVTQSDQQGGDQCWDHALPCTPYFDAEKLKRVGWR